VIDEAFGRGSDESTKFALELFGRLGLQLLIVTPLLKNPASKCAQGLGTAHGISRGGLPT
jgi:hypothetical protein